MERQWRGTSRFSRRIFSATECVNDLECPFGGMGDPSATESRGQKCHLCLRTEVSPMPPKGHSRSLTHSVAEKIRREKREVPRHCRSISRVGPVGDLVRRKVPGRPTQPDVTMAVQIG